MQDRRGFIMVPHAEDICLIGIKAGSRWTIKDVSMTLGSISIARPNASPDSLVGSYRKCKATKK